MALAFVFVAEWALREAFADLRLSRLRSVQEGAHEVDQRVSLATAELESLRRAMERSAAPPQRCAELASRLTLLDSLYLMRKTGVEFAWPVGIEPAPSRELLLRLKGLLAQGQKVAVMAS